MKLIGIDCASKAKEAAFAVARIDVERLIVEQVSRGQGNAPLAEGIGPSIAAHLGSEPVLLALDAPLGWPQDLVPALDSHLAGAVIATHPDLMFRRASERFVECVLKKRPLEVGANLIARTAHAANALLGALRDTSSINMGWQPGRIDGVGAIEVYPAATLLGREQSEKGYKGKAKGRREAQKKRRGEILDALSEEITMTADCRDECIDSDHALDAVLCALAAADFVQGQATVPMAGLPDGHRKEGWIWFWDRRGPLQRDWSDPQRSSTPAPA